MNETLIETLYLVYLLLTPAAIMLLARRWTWIDKISPMAVLYIIGLLVANLTPWVSQHDLLFTNNFVGNLGIPIAIPLMLLSCRLAGWSLTKTIKAFLIGLTAVLVATVAGFFIFRNGNDPQQFAQICAVAIGIYTGGIPNMGAIAQGVNMNQETYLYVTSYDLIITGLYLIFVICFGKPVFRKLLPAPTPEKSAPNQQESHQINPVKPWLQVAIPALITLVTVAISYSISTLVPEQYSTPVLILLLTTLAIAASFLPIIRRINFQADTEGLTPRSFSIGLYFVYLFCFSIANACDVRTMDLTGSLSILWYIIFIIFGSLLLQIIISRLLRVDGDTTLVSSVALINSPPFVPLVAALLNNKNLIVVGITIGMLGYMIGNYLGLAIFYILSMV